VGDRLILNAWWPGLASGGPWRERLRERRDAGVAIADLHRWRDSRGDGELVVEFVSGGERKHAEAVLEGWASLAGYRRIWFDDRMVDLGADPRDLPTAGVTCTTCGARWDDGKPEFWKHVRQAGCFPRTCMLCGGELPQWQVAEADDPAGGCPAEVEPAGLGSGY
jgi:hypothetical protein